MILDDDPNSRADATESGAAHEPTAPGSGSPESFEAPVPAAPVVPEDLRIPWGWVDLLLFVVVTIAATVIIGIIVFVGFTAFGVTLSELRTSAAKEGLFAVINQAVLFVGLIGYLAAQIRLRYGATFWRTIGWRRLETGTIPRGLTYLGFIAGGCLLAIVVDLIAAEFGTKKTLPIEQLFQDRLTASLILLMAVLVAPLVEETIFRGYIYPVVARSFGRGVGVVATGTLFGLLHSSQLWGGWIQIALLVFVGIVLTYARAVKGTVLASFLIHASYNSFVSVAFVIASHGLKILPPGS